MHKSETEETEEFEAQEDTVKSLKSKRLRQCVLTRQSFDVDDLVRFVLSPDGLVCPDLKRQLPGRGVWITAQADMIEKAVKKQIFRKVFRQEVRVEAELAAKIDHLIEYAALQRLALANKAGLVVTGFAKIMDALEKKKVFALVHSSEAAADGVEKLGKKWLNINGGQEKTTRIVKCFTTAQLSLALGRENVVHAALKQGGTNGIGARIRVMEDVAYLERYRRCDGPLDIGHKSE